MQSNSTPSGAQNGLSPQTVRDRQSFFIDREQMQATLAEVVEVYLRSRLQGLEQPVLKQPQAVAHQPVLIALAGGSTPFPIYQRLAASPLDFSRVTAVVGDERWVAAPHAGNNLEKLRSSFAAASGITFLDLLPSPLPEQASADHANTVLEAHAPTPFDLVILGMGNDGHFASLFPHAAELHHGYHTSDSALLVNPEPLPAEAPFARVSLSLKRLIHTQRLMLWITGAEKRSVFEAAELTAKAHVCLPRAALLEANVCLPRAALLEANVCLPRAALLEAHVCLPRPALLEAQEAQGALQLPIVQLMLACKPFSPDPNAPVLEMYWSP